MQRSKREGSEIGFAARKHSEMDLRMQRSGREGAVVGFAGQEQTEANLWWQRSGRERAVVGFAEREGRGWGARGGGKEGGQGGEQGGSKEGRVRGGRARREGRPCKTKVRSLGWGFGPLWFFAAVRLSYAWCVAAVCLLYCCAGRGMLRRPIS